MGNTTFNGPVRSENGFEQITVAASTGVETTNFDIDTSGNITTSGTINARVKVDNSTFAGAGGATDTLTIAESGTAFIVNGTAANVVNMPALSTSNVGVQYHFFLTTAVGGSVTTTLVLPGSGVSNFFGLLQLIDGTAHNPDQAISGDTLTWVNSTQANARITVTCMTDDGTNSTWKAEVLSTPIATIG